jgi:hypothetical protein
MLSGTINHFLKFHVNFFLWISNLFNFVNVIWHIVIATC